MNSSNFSHLIVGWYHQNKRDLPWRNTMNPYKIWLSEVILQQTRVAQGLPYYLKFVENFPDVKSLALADEQKVLRLWQGLGYYSRARNLHKCAKMVAEKYHGFFPKKYQELLKLPGIGKYTAAAIASFSYQEPVPVVDGNVYRVLSRVFGIDTDIASNEGAKKFYEVSERLIPHDKPDDYNQAIMEFGALQCTPKKPNCDDCPVVASCYAYENNMQGSLPVKTKKVKVKTRYFNYIVFSHAGNYLMKKREGEGIWEGLHDFHLVETNKSATPDELAHFDEVVGNVIGQGLLEEESKIYKHVLTHQRIFAMFLKIELKSLSAITALAKKNNYGVYDVEQVRALPKPILVNNYLKEHIF